MKEFKRQLLTHTLNDTWPVFPSRELPHQVNVGGLAEEMLFPGASKTKAYMPAVCVGTRYNTIFDREGDPPHLTIEVSMLRRIVDGQPAGAIIGTDTVPWNRLALVRHIINLTEVT